MKTKSLIDYLEAKITQKMEAKWFPKFERQAKYLGNGIYSIPGTNLMSTDTRELFLMMCAVEEGIKIPNEPEVERDKDELKEELFIKSISRANGRLRKLMSSDEIKYANLLVKSGKLVKGKSDESHGTVAYFIS